MFDVLISLKKRSCSGAELEINSTSGATNKYRCPNPILLPIAISSIAITKKEVTGTTCNVIPNGETEADR